MSEETEIVQAIERTLYPVEEPATELAPAPVTEIEPEPELKVVPKTELEEADEDEDLEEIKQQLEEPEESEDVETMAAVLGLKDEQVSVKETGEVIINATVDGTPVEVPLADIIGSYQGVEYATKKANEVIEQQQQLEQQTIEIQQEAAQKLAQMEQVSKLMEQELLSDYNQHNWQELNQINPHEYNRLRDIYSQKAQRIKDLQGKLSQEGSQQQEQAMQQHQQHMQKVLEAESAKVLANNPTWHDQKVKDTDMGNLRKFLVSGYGYSDEEISMISDSRLVKLIQDAYNGSSLSKTTKQKEVVPKYQNSKLNRVASAANARAAKARKAALKKSGSNAALASVLLDRM